MATPIITKEQIMALLDKAYELALTGIPGEKSCEELAEEYLRRNSDAEKAAKEFEKWQITKCTASGFITSLGGILTLPIAVPANIASVLYVQLRMIAVIAYMGGYDPKDDITQTLAYICLIKTSISDICKKSGINVANKMSISLLKRLPGTLLARINKMVGFRLFTKFGTKGVINLSKAVPIVGGIVGGGVDFISTKNISSRAINVFIKNQID